MRPLSGEALGALLSRVCNGDDDAWTEFVECFAPLLLAAARTIERDRDATADAFVFVCEQLRARRFTARAAGAVGILRAGLRVECERTLVPVARPSVVAELVVDQGRCTSTG